ncbi:MAG: hypothetical protein H6R18_2975 [Proteobacteria bacterium]|nr:hypothetical protein [Pseudomonadota bacterium]
MEWKDKSSFSQGDKVRTPKSFEARAGSLRITVTRHIHHDPADWVLICEPWFSQTVISTGTADEAKEAAVIAVRKKLAETLAALTPNVK